MGLQNNNLMSKQYNVLERAKPAWGWGWVMVILKKCNRAIF